MVATKRNRRGNPGKLGITPGNTGKWILQDYQDGINKNNSGFVQRSEALGGIFTHNGPKVIIKIAWEASHILQMNQELCDLEGCRKPSGLGDFNTEFKPNFYQHAGFCGID